MDTRTKIVDASEAAVLARNGAVVVSGYFDPLTASNAERLAELKTSGAKLLVLIATPQKPILAPRARAELVASLGVVDFVSELNGTVTPQIRLESEDELRLAKLIEHVHARQGST